MAQGGKPNPIWIIENCLIPELKTISPSNDPGYVTDFRGNVSLARFGPTNMPLVNDGFRDAALLLWLDRLGESRTVPGGHLGAANRHWSFDVYFIGGVKGDKSLHIDTVTSAEDHKRCMDKNPARDQVGGSAVNTWGINTRLVEPYRFIWDALEQGIGKWDCVWGIDYSTPTAG